jgi:putative phosphoesterase
MKIAVISDIHGNLEALEAVMADIEKEKCEKVFALGDYAMAGPEPWNVIEWFMEKSNDEKFELIQGNTDLMIADYNSELYSELQEKAPVMAEALKDDFFQINILQKEFLKNLPPQLELTIEGVKILLVHGSPRRNNEDILPSTTLKEVEYMLKDIDAELVLCGHTHIPCGFQTETNKTLINVGSVGRPFTKEPKSCYLLITIKDGKCLFQHKFIDYNKERAALKLRGRNFLGANKLANMLLDPQIRHF